LICNSSSLEVALARRKALKKGLKNVPKHYSLMMIGCGLGCGQNNALLFYPGDNPEY